MAKKFTPEFRDRAVRMVFDRQATKGGPSGLSQFWFACSLRLARARATLSRIDSAVAVHT